MTTFKIIALSAILLTGGMAIAQKPHQKNIAITANTLLIEGHVLDAFDEPLDKATVRVRRDHKDLAVWSCDKNGSFDLTLDIGGLYAIDVRREGYLRKRFIVDARSEDPSKVRSIPFEAFITLLPLSAVEGADLDDFDFPFALLTYSPKLKAFMADPDYIAQMRKLEIDVTRNAGSNKNP